MAKLESSLKNMIVSLGVISLVASGLLGVVQKLTEAPIAKAQKDKQEQAIKAVLPDKTAQIGSPDTIRVEGKENPYIVFPATKDGKLVGAAIQTYSKKGYAGLIEVMVGMDTTGAISNYEMITTGETAGLGSKLGFWFKTNRGKQSVLGKSPKTSNFKVSKDGGDFDAITASTISSRAFMESMRDAYTAFVQYQNKK
jgi:electron transport complex, RnfABCDGE type, G subunit